MNQAQLIQQAKQQDPESIKALLNLSLQSRRVMIDEVTLEGENCLVLKIISRKVPNQHKLLPFLQAEFNSLGIPNIEQVKVYGLTDTSEVPAWEDTISLNQDWTIENNIAKLDTLPVSEVEESQTEEEETEITEPSPPQPIYESPYKYQNPLENPSAFSTTAPQKQSSILPLLMALGLGFAWGLVVGIPIGSMQSTNKSAETIEPSPSATISPGTSPAPTTEVSPVPVTPPSP